MKTDKHKLDEIEAQLSRMHVATDWGRLERRLRRLEEVCHDRRVVCNDCVYAGGERPCHHPDMDGIGQYGASPDRCSPDWCPRLWRNR